MCGCENGWHDLACQNGSGPYLLSSSSPPISLEPKSKHEPPLAGPPTPPVRQIGNMVVVPVDEVPPQWADQAVTLAIPTDEQMKRAHDGVEPWCDTDAEWDAWLSDHDRRVNAEATSWRIRAESAEAALDRQEQER